MLVWMVSMVVYGGLYLTPEFMLKVDVAPGTCEVLKVTGSAGPLFAETVIENVTLDPCVTRVVVGNTVRSKSDGCGPADVLMRLIVTSACPC